MAVSPTSGKKSGIAAPTRSLDPTLRYDWLKASEDTKYKGAGRNIFRAEVEIPKPIAPVQTQPSQSSRRGRPRRRPSISNFSVLPTSRARPKKIFLSQGEDVFIAGEGDIIDRRYRILHITPVSVEVEDVLNNNRQSIPLTQG